MNVAVGMILKGLGVPAWILLPMSLTIVLAVSWLLAKIITSIPFVNKCLFPR